MNKYLGNKIINVSIMIWLGLILGCFDTPQITKSSETKSSKKITKKKSEETNNNKDKPEETLVEQPTQTSSLFQFKSLKDWSEAVVQWDESSVARAIERADLIVDLAKNKVPIEEFDQALSSASIVMSTGTITNAEHWLDQLKPDAAFYDVASFGKDLKSTIDPDAIHFGQKIRMAADSLIVVMGDFHGSLHSLIRNLWRLRLAGYIDNNFKISNDKAYLIFTGDFVDRGRYSVETLYTLMRLKIANPDKVYLLRGNHESEEVSRDYGLIPELVAKYGDEKEPRLFKDIIDFYRFLPIVLLATVNNSTTPSFLHFSHGGFSYDAQKEQLIHWPTELLAAAISPSYEIISSPAYLGYMWSDFHQHDETIRNVSRGFDDTKKGVSIIGKQALETYFRAGDVKQSGNLMGFIFRGHQDRAFGLKMLFKDLPSMDEMDQLAIKNRSYPDGPFFWHDVVQSAAEIAQAKTTGFDMSPYRPVFTFTTATEGQGVPEDAYGIIHLSADPKNYRLEVHETRLQNRTMDRSYITMAPAQAGDDGITTTWSLDAPGKLLLDP